MAQENPLDGISMDQLNLQDPETYNFVEQNVDVNDPETAKYLQQFKPQSAPPAPQKEMGSLERIWANTRTAAQEGFGGQIAQKYYDWSEYGKDDLRKAYPKASEDELEKMQERLIAQARRSVSDEVQSNLDKDPAWKPDEGFWGNIGRTLEGFAGGLVGSADPTMLLAPGANAIQRMGAQGVISGAADAGYQAANIGEGYKKPDEFDLAQVGMNTLFGVASQGLFEIPPFVKGLFETRGKDTTPDGSPRSEAGKPLSNQPLSPDAEAEWVQLQQTGSADDMIDFMKRNNRMTDAAWIDTIRQYAKSRDATGQASSSVVYQDPIDGEVNVPVERNSVEDLGDAFAQAEQIGGTAKPKPAIIENAQKQVIKKVQNIVEKWENSPEIEVHTNFNDLPDVDPQAVGVTTPEGKVLLNVENIAREAKAMGVHTDDMISAVTFHEGLGHHGLTQKFGDELDNILENLYARAPKFQKAVDEWMTNNPDAYIDDVNPVARGTEEVLAEMSEKGKIDPSLMERLRAWIRKTGRKIGLDLDFNDNEIKVILGMAHNATTSGKPRDVAGNGYRYATRVDDMSDIRRIEESRYIEPTEYLEPQKMEALGDNGMRMPTTNETVSKQFAEGLDERGLARHKTAAWKEKAKNQEPVIGNDETLTFDNGKTVDITTYEPHQIQRLIEQRMGSRNRNMRRRSLGTSEGASDQRRAVGNFRSNRPIGQLIEDVLPEKQAQTVDDWISDASDIRMTTRIAESLSAGAEAPELLSARKFLTESSNRAYDLTKKISQGVATSNEKYLLTKELERVERIGNVIDDIVSNAGRILRSQQVGVESDKALTTGLRNMARKHDLSTDEGLEAASKELSKTIKNKKTRDQLLRVFSEVLNLPRSIMSSFDLSAPFRQAIGLVHKKQWWGNLGPMMKAAFSEDYFKKLNDEIASRPSYKLMDKSGLAFTDLGHKLSNREEMFMSTWAGKIPVLGRFIKGSERAYSGFLNKVRADVFDDLVKNAKASGVEVTPELAKDLAKVVNVASGRGNLGSFEQAAPALAGALFSPRLMMARLQTFNPMYYVTLSPAARKEAIKSGFATATYVSTLLGLLSAAGADVELDPRSSDFAKARIGNTRYDIAGGYSQYVTLFSRILLDSTKTGKGEIKDYGSGRNDQNSFDAMIDFASNKASPVASYIIQAMKKKTPTGEDFDPGKGVVERFLPMIVSDFLDMQKKYETGEALGRIAPAVAGAGVTDREVKGSDRFGRDYNNPKKLQDPAIDEIDRLFDGETSDKIRDVPKSVQRDGEKVELSEDEHIRWQKLTGEYFLEDLKEAVADPVWKTLTDEEKIEEVRLIRKDAKADALVDSDILADETREGDE